MARSEQYVFGEFTLDASERLLLKDGRRVALAPKAYDVLVTLVRAAGRLVTKSDLLNQVWHESFVEEGVLSVHVSALRKALGDGGRRYIETVARSGYRFTAKVSQPAGRWSVGILPADPEIYELLGQGRAHLLTASMHEVAQAIDAFQAAIALDPAYAAAHAGLALAYCAQAQFRLAPHAEAYSHARAAALRALAMHEASVDAQVALGTVLFLSDWNWIATERSCRRALEINPEHTQALLLYGQLLEALGRLDEGLEVKQRALERDPHSAIVHLQVALAQWHRRNYAGAIEWARKALVLDPRHLLAREFLAGAYWKMGDADAHMREMIAHAQCHGVPLAALDPLREAYARGGRPAVLRLGLQRQAELPDMRLALMRSELGELDATFEHLDRAIASRDPSLVHLAVAPQWDHLRGDVRFAERVAQMGLI